MSTLLTEAESFAEFRARRRREVTGPRGAVSFVWGDFVVEADQRVEGAPGRWSPLPDGRAGLAVRASREDAVRIGGVLVDGSAVLHHEPADGPTVADFGGGAEGVVFTYDGSRYALQVWDAHSTWAKRFHEIAVFDEDPSWVVEATVRRLPAGQAVTITHHRDPAPVDVPVAAEVVFTRHGATHRLLARPAGGATDRLLVHFRDATNGVETYGVGRTLWLPANHEGALTLDFNHAVLLPCSFSRAWNCPFPPSENRLPIAVRAGERYAVDVDGEQLL